MRILGIESSCDETAAAVVQSDGLVLSDVVKSQVAVHAPYGGVVPEIAARDHLRAAVPVVEKALADAGLKLADVDGIAVTARPDAQPRKQNWQLLATADVSGFEEELRASPVEIEIKKVEVPKKK